MKLDTVIRLTSPEAIDFAAKGAAFKLAWRWTAQELWSARKFGTDHRALFAQKLRAAHADVAQTRRRQRQAEAAAADPRVAALLHEQGMLYFKPFEQGIIQRLNQINAEIAQITASM
jgi:hypothetical protein